MFVKLQQKPTISSDHIKYEDHLHIVNCHSNQLPCDYDDHTALIQILNHYEYPIDQFIYLTIINTHITHLLVSSQNYHRNHEFSLTTKHCNEITLTDVHLTLLTHYGTNLFQSQCTLLQYKSALSVFSGVRVAQSFLFSVYCFMDTSN